MLLAQGLLLAPLAGLGITLLSQRDDIAPVILLGAAVTPAVLGQMYGLSIFQGRLQFAQMNLARVVPAGLYAAFALILLISGTGSLAAVTAAFLVANVVAAVVTLYPSIRIGGDEEVVDGLPLVRFGLRSWLGSISPLDTFRFDQIVVVVLFTQAIVGIYVVALAFSNLPRFIGLSIGLIAYPRVAAMRTGNERRRAIFGYTLITMILTAPLVFFIAAAAGPIIGLFFGEAYASSAALVGPLVAAGWLAGGRRTMTEAARGASLTAAGSIAELTAWIAFAVTAILATPAMHERGIAVAMLVGSAAGIIAMITLVLRSPWNVGGEHVLAEDLAR